MRFQLKTLFIFITIFCMLLAFFVSGGGFQIAINDFYYTRPNSMRFWVGWRIHEFISAWYNCDYNTNSYGLRLFDKTIIMIPDEGPSA